MTAPENWIAELRRLVNAASPGPWDDEPSVMANNNYVAGTGPWQQGWHVGGTAAATADAAFIAAARTALPRLLALVDAADRVMTAVRECTETKGWNRVNEVRMIEALLRAYEEVRK